MEWVNFSLSLDYSTDPFYFDTQRFTCLLVQLPMMGGSMKLAQVGEMRGSIRGWGRWAALGFVLSAAACYPGDGPTNVQDLDVVLTVHDQDVNFGSFLTFVMPDTVLHVSSDQGDDIIDLPRTADELILSLVADNMAAAGYLRERDWQTGADLIMLAGAIASEKTEYWAYQDWWNYWGWWPGWGYPGYPGYGPGYGWYYPPGFVGSTTFEAGSVVLTLVDPERGDGDAIPVIWSGVVRGLLNYGGETARITKSINQMFSQSPYLGR
jgi:hypothetical protein